jgi:carbon-monoxide dehydrogenase large subunit
VTELIGDAVRTSSVGQRILRKEDPRFLRGEARFLEGLGFPDALHAVFVRSQVAHARIVGVDPTEARSRPGIQVFTAADVGVGSFVRPFATPAIVSVPEGLERPFVAGETVRFVGEIVAVVLAHTRADALDAAELVVVDYEPLPVVVDPREALRDEVVLFPEVGTNVCARIEQDQPDASLFDGCEVVISGSVRLPRMAACPLEPRSAAAVAGDDGRVTVWLTTQAPHLDRRVLATSLGLEVEDVRVIGLDVGGGFGSKTPSGEGIVVAALARATGRPVRWTETRSEGMIGLTHGRGQLLDFTLGGTRSGIVEAYRLDVIQDAGAYLYLASLLPVFTRMMASGVYLVPKIEFTAVSVLTNTAPVSAFRGAGRPEAAQAIERAMDLFAAEIGMDPAEVRRRNFIPPEAFPFTTPTDSTYDSGDYERALDLVLAAAGYEALREEQGLRRAEGGPLQLGIGLSVYCELTNDLPFGEFAEVDITRDGEAVVRTGSFAHGQGHETTFAQIVSDKLGLPIESIRVRAGDTDEIVRGGGTFSSKSTQIGGAAASNAAAEVVEKARILAAGYLAVQPDDVVFDLAAALFHVVGDRTASLGWPELAGSLAADGRLDELRVEHDFHPGASTYPFGAHLAVVEVDTETGNVTVERMVAVDDAGRIINPMVAEGQIHGGLAAGIGEALYEEIVYDTEGNLLTSNFASYGFASAAELPSFELQEMETPSPVNPLGVKGIGESGTIGSTPAVQSAVIDALRPFGVRHIDIPVNGERVWRALAEAGA